ncbi:beta strand repeat-containing protein, partial [Helicobacter cappadocius]
MRNITYKTKLMPYDVQNSVMPPPPSSLFKSPFSKDFDKLLDLNNKKIQKKTFIPIISLVLSSFFLSFSGELRATTFGNSNCTFDSESACIGGNYSGGGLTLSGSGDNRTLKLSGGFWSGSSSIKSMNVYKSILNTGSGKDDFYYASGSTVNASLKDSVWNGDIENSDNNFGGVSSFSFSGNYTGDSNASLKGYAFVGNVSSRLAKMKMTFSDGAIWKGGIRKNYKDNKEQGAMLEATFDSGSKWLTTLSPSYGNIDATFTNNSSIVGSITNRTGEQWNWSLDNSSIDANIKLTDNSNFIFTLKNQSNMKKDIEIDSGYLSITSESNSTIDGNIKATGGTSNIVLNSSSFAGTITTSGGSITQGKLGGTLTLNAESNSIIGKSANSSSNELFARWGSIAVNLDNSTMYGRMTWRDGTLNATFKNHSQFIGDIGGGITPSTVDPDLKNTVSNVTFVDSSMKGNIVLKSKLVSKINPTTLNNELKVSFSGNSSFEGTVSTDSTAGTNLKAGKVTLDASFDNTTLNIKSISATSASSDSTLNFKNISNAKIGNISFNNGTITGDFSSSSLGDIINTSQNSSLSLKNTQGQSYGNIGTSSLAYNGSLFANFDFTDNENSKTTIGNIYLGSNSKADISFNFSVSDDNNIINNKQSNAKITGGNASSSFSFSNIGTLSLKTDILDSITDNTGIVLSNIKGNLSLSKTNVILAPSSTDTSTPDNTSSFSLSKANTSLALNATFGNAMLEDSANRTPNIVANDSNIFYTLTNTASSTTNAEYVKGKSSNGNIGYVGDNIEKHINFVFTEGTFDNKTSGYTGTIRGGTANSTYGFYNAGSLNVSQITDYLGTLNLYNTLLVDVIGKTIETKAADGTVTSTPKDVSISLDYSKNSNPYGLGIVGIGKHNITFNFTDNSNAIKFGGTLLGGTTDKIAGSNNTDNQITIYGLEGVENKQSDSNNSLVELLHNAGVIGINAVDGIKNSNGTTDSFTDSKSQAHISGYKDVKSTDKNIITKGTTFKFLNTTFNSDLKESDYALDLTFTSAEVANEANIKNANNDPSSPVFNPNTSIPLVASSFNGEYIDLGSNIYDNNLSFLGQGSITNKSNLLNVTLGSGKTNIVAIDTNSTLVLTNTDKVATNSSLKLSNTSLIGDWNNGGSFIFGDNVLLNADGTSSLVNSKFYGRLSSNNNSALSVILNHNSLLSSSDSNVKNSYQGKLKSTPSGSITSIFDVPTINFSNTDSSKNKLILDNPGGVLKLTGLSKTVSLSSDSTLTSKNTSIIGDIYGNSFQTSANG